MAFEETGVDAIVKGFTTFMLQMKAVNKSIAATGIAGKGASVGVMALNVAFSAAKLAAGLAAAAIAGIAIAAGLFGIAAVKASISVESAFAGLAKTTPGLTDEFGKMNEEGKDMTQQFRNLALEIPLAVEELLEIGALGGQLNVPKEAIVAFTETIAALAVSTNLASDEAATNFAVIANIYGDNASEMASNTAKLGSAVVFLGNNYATTERDILAFTERIAASGKLIGLSRADIAGISAAFTAVGIEAQAGGTAVQKVLMKMQAAAAEGGEKFEGFAEVAALAFKDGELSAESFLKIMEEDSAEAFTLFVEGLGIAGDDAFAILGDLEIADQRLLRAFLSTAGAGDLLRTAIDDSNVAFEANTALTREAEIRYATAEAKITMFKNAIRDAAISVGDELRPALEKVLEKTTPFVNAFSKAIGPAVEGVVETFENDLLPALSTLAKSLGVNFDPASFSESIAGIGESIEGVITKVGLLVGAFNDEGLKGLAVEIGIPEDTIQKIEDFGVAIDNLDLEKIGKIAGFIAIVGGVALAVGGIAAAIGPAIVSINAFLVILGNIGAFIGLVVGAISGGGGLTAVLGGVAAAIVVAIGPVLAIGIALGILVAAIVLFGEDAKANFLALKEQVGIIFTALKDKAIVAWDKMITSIKNKLTDLWFKAKTAWRNMKDDAIEKWEQMKAAVTAAIVKLGSDIKGKFNEIKNNIAEKWNTIKETAIEAWVTLKDAIRDKIDEIKQAVSDKFNKVKDDITQTWENIKTSIIDKVGSIKKAISAKFKEIGQAILKKMGVDGEEMKGRWGKIWEDIKLIISTAIERVKTTITDKVEEIRSNVQEKLEEIKTTWKENWDNLVEIVSEIIERVRTTISEKIEGIKTSITERLEELKAQWKENWENLITIVSAIIERIKNRIAEKFTEVKDNTTSKWEEIKTAVTEAVDKMRKFVNEKITALKEKITAIWERVKAIAIEKWNALKLAVATKALELLTKAIKVLDPIREKIKAIWEKVKARTITLWNNIKKAIKKKIEQLKTAVGVKFDNIKLLIEEKIKDFKQVGKDLIQGLIDGALEMAGALATAITGLVEKGIAAAKAALGIESPSRIFFDIGENTMKGLSLGIDDGNKMVDKSMANSMDNMVGMPQTVGLGARSMPMNTGQTTQNSNNSFNPTVNANYFDSQSPNEISDDLALVAMMGSGR